MIYPKGFGQTPIRSTKLFLKLAPPEPLWTPGLLIESGLVTIPFRLALPLDLPPSFADGERPRDGMTRGLSAKIDYLVVVRGSRCGFFRTGLWIEQEVKIVKTASITEDVLNKGLLLTGPWSGAWRLMDTEVCLLHGARARAEVWDSVRKRQS
jgi:hypothetical protein